MSQPCAVALCPAVVEPPERYCVVHIRWATDGTPLLVQRSCLSCGHIHTDRRWNYVCPSCPCEMKP